MRTFTLYTTYFIWCYLTISLITFSNAWIELMYLILIVWFSMNKVFPFLKRNLEL